MQPGRYPSSGSSSLRKDVPREILRAQDRLKVEQQQFGIRKHRTLKQSETYHAAPLGYVFMPLGTPALAELCKEMSRQEGHPIHVVNAKPSSKVVLDPTKVSHHVQRIGYHFKDSIVEEACSQLNYMIADGKFVSESDLKQNSFVAKVMARHGLQASKLAKREPTEKLKAAIRELFPAIPDSDLDQVVKHAWDENTGRVGTIEDMDLSRRIQLAVLARIRHTYTDYDTLLKVFEWTECRRLVEPACLKKLLQWRGETGDGKDAGLEEIVAETMLLEEQSDAPDAVRRSNTRAQQLGFDAGEASDASIEITHRVAAGEDLRAESPVERSQRFFRIHQPPVHTLAQRHDIARAKLQEARAQMQHQHHQAPYESYVDEEHVEYVHVSTDGSGQAPHQILVNGRLLQRAPPEPPAYTQSHQAYTPSAYQPIHGTPALVQQAGHRQLLVPNHEREEVSYHVPKANPGLYPPMPPLLYQPIPLPPLQHTSRVGTYQSAPPPPPASQHQAPVQPSQAYGRAYGQPQPNPAETQKYYQHG